MWYHKSNLQSLATLITITNLESFSKQKEVPEIQVKSFTTFAHKWVKFLFYN